MIHYGDQEFDYREEVSRLSRELSDANEKIKRLQARIRALSESDKLLVAEESAEILGCKGFEVKELADRAGLKFILKGNRRFYRRSQIEKLRGRMY